MTDPHPTDRRPPEPSPTDPSVSESSATEPRVARPAASDPGAGDQRILGLPPLAQVGVLAVLVGLGLSLGGAAGAVVLGIVVLALVGILVASWRRLLVPERLLRIAAIALLAAVTVVRVVPA